MGAVSFVQHFGSALNARVHFHCWVIDRVFVAGADGQVQFVEAAALIPPPRLHRHRYHRVLD